jgi:MFS family permease
MLVGALLGVVFGRASDMFGRKYLQLAASVSGIIGSAIAVRTNSMRVLMVASAFHGISNAGHQLSLTSIVEIFPRRYRALANGLFVAALLPAAGFSPLIGAALILHSSWRALYWLALGLYIFSFIGTLLFYHPDEILYQETESFGKRLIQFDYIGAFLVVGGIITIAMGLIFGGTVFPW